MKQSFKKFIFKYFTSAQPTRKVVFIGQFQKGGSYEHSEAYKQSEIEFISNTLFQPKKFLTDIEIIEKVHSYIGGRKYFKNCTVSIVENTIVIQKGY